MATWITHLRLAEALIPHLPDLDEAMFAIGNIAPDSGVPDENWEIFNPPVEITHFKTLDCLQWRCADWQFYRRCLQLVAPEQDRSRYSFRIGYFFHLVTDNLCSRQIGRPTQQQYAAQFTVDPEMWSKVKRDWYGEDFSYVRSRPHCLYWRTFLGCSYRADYLDFLPAAAVQRNIEYIQHFYQRTDDEIEHWYIQRPGLYLTTEMMDHFVAHNTACLIDVFGLIHNARLERDDCYSVLDLVAT